MAVWTSDRTSWLEGPSYDGAGGIWFADPGNILTDFAEPTRVLRYDLASGATSTELQFDGDQNVFGTAFDVSGRLLTTEISPTQPGLFRRAVGDLANPENLAATFEGVPILANDLVFDAAGGLYFTDWKQNTPELGDSGVYYLPASGELSKAQTVPQATSANGVGISPDNKTLYVARPFAGGVFAYDIGAPGVLTNERLFAVVPGATDGLTVDLHGNVFVSDLAADPMAVPPCDTGTSQLHGASI